MKKVMLMNAVHPEQKRLAIVDGGKLVEYNIQMAIKEPITGNLYKGVVMKVERGLQAAFVNYGGKRDGFLPLHDVSPEYFTESNGKGSGSSNHRLSLKAGQEVLVQVIREETERKGGSSYDIYIFAGTIPGFAPKQTEQRHFSKNRR